MNKDVTNRLADAAKKESQIVEQGLTRLPGAGRGGFAIQFAVSGRAKTTTRTVGIEADLYLVGY
jgi:hypothetical protein